MKRFHAVLIAAAALLAAISLAAQSQQQTPQTAQQPSKPPFTLTSTGFEDGGVIPETFTGPTPTSFQNSPPLAWANAPDGTVSFVLLVHDLDGSINKRTDDDTHWLIYNIPGSATGLPEGVKPAVQLADGSVQALNSHNNPGYIGPGARGKYHHYTFEVYALDIKLNVPTDAPRADIINAMQGHILGKAVLVGRYKR